MLEFEWDEIKNWRNVKKHAISFGIAERFFGNPHFEKLDDRHDYGEERWVAVGEVDGIVLVVVYAAISSHLYRLISIRRASRYEQEAYYKWRSQ